MSMCDSIKKERTEEIETKDEQGNVTTSQVKIISLLQRRDKWVKFGNVKNLARGQNERGLINITGPAKFMTDEGEDINQEIEIAQDLIEMGKKHLMSKQLKI